MREGEGEVGAGDDGGAVGGGDGAGAGDGSSVGGVSAAGVCACAVVSGAVVEAAAGWRAGSCAGELPESFDRLLRFERFFSSSSAAYAASSRAYASRLRPWGVVRPVSHDLTVARVTPTAVATCRSVSSLASRSLRRSLGEGSGGTEEVRVVLCVMKNSPQHCTGRKST